MTAPTVDRLIPSVEDAVHYLDMLPLVLYVGDGGHGHELENAALALDMALAQASDRRRAEADEIRRSVAW